MGKIIDRVRERERKKNAPPRAPRKKQFAEGDRLVGRMTSSILGQRGKYPDREFHRVTAYTSGGMQKLEVPASVPAREVRSYLQARLVVIDADRERRVMSEARLLEKMEEAASTLQDCRWVARPADLVRKPWWAFWRRG